MNVRTLLMINETYDNVYITFTGNFLEDRIKNGIFRTTVEIRKFFFRNQLNFDFYRRIVLTA